MRLFLDTEFTGLHRFSELIALAIISEDGYYFYAEFTDYDTAQLSDWHRQHVLPNLFLGSKEQFELPANGTLIHNNTTSITAALHAWLQRWEAIEMWADVPAYDWVLFCELFGGALHLPSNVHYIVRDLATLLQTQSYDPDTDRFALAFGDNTPPAGLPRHNALGDAWACKNCVTKLLNP